MRENRSSHLVSWCWSDEKLILLYCPGRGLNSQPPAHRSVNMIKVSYALTTRPGTDELLLVLYLSAYISQSIRYVLALYLCIMTVL